MTAVVARSQIDQPKWASQARVVCALGVFMFLKASAIKGTSHLNILLTTTHGCGMHRNFKILRFVCERFLRKILSQPRGSRHPRVFEITWSWDRVEVDELAPSCLHPRSLHSVPRSTNDPKHIVPYTTPFSNDLLHLLPPM